MCRTDTRSSLIALLACADGVGSTGEPELAQVTSQPTESKSEEERS
jgi:hypothetical protein